MATKLNVKDLAKAVADYVRPQIEHEILDILRKSIEPNLRKIAADAALQVAQHCTTDISFDAAKMKNIITIIIDGNEAAKVED